MTSTTNDTRESSSKGVQTIDTKAITTSCTIRCEHACNRYEQSQSTSLDIEEVQNLIEECELYSLPGYQLSTAQHEHIQMIRSRLLVLHRNLLDLFPDFLGSYERERIEELQQELHRLSSVDMNAIGFSGRQRLVDEIDLRCFEYQRDKSRSAHAFGAALATFNDCIDELLAFRRQCLEIDIPYFESIRKKRKEGTLTLESLGEEFLSHVTTDGPHSRKRIGPADYFLTHLLGVFQTPDHKLEFTDDMRHYYPTPASVFSHLLNILSPTREDVFYDFGSGMGRLPLLVRLLTPATAHGIEFEPAYHQVAEKLSKDLCLDRVYFRCEDARTSDIADGSIFYFYEPFRGQLLEQVVAQLQQVAEEHPIKVVSYGETQCTRYLKEQTFLALESETDALFIFSSIV